MKYLVHPSDDKKSGIYIIRNSRDDRVYIGSSVSIKKRYQAHLNTLKRGEHRNPYLQSFFNKYGDILSFQVVEVCHKDRLLELEQAYIDSYDFDTELFNLVRLVVDACGTRGLRWSEESKNNLKASLNSTSSIEKRRDNYRADIGLVNDLTNVIRLLDGTRTARDVSNLLGVRYSLVVAVVQRRAHSWLVDEIVNRTGLPAPKKLLKHDYSVRNRSKIQPEVIKSMVAMRLGGSTYRHIGDTLGLSPTTVSTHIRNYNEQTNG